MRCQNMQPLFCVLTTVVLSLPSNNPLHTTTQRLPSAEDQIDASEDTLDPAIESRRKALTTALVQYIRQQRADRAAGKLAARRLVLKARTPVVAAHSGMIS